MLRPISIRNNLAVSGGNASSLKQMNRAIVMRLIQQSGGISRANIAQRSGLSRGGLTTIVNQLMDLRLIVEGESIETPNGRHPINLQLNAKWIKTISVLWARDKLAIAVVNAENVVEYVSEYRFNGSERAQEIFDVMTNVIQGILHGQKNSLILGIMVMGPGPLDPIGGRILAPTNFYGWHDVDIVGPLVARFGLPVFLENDLIGYAMAEQRLGFGQGLDSFIILSIGDGIGAELINNGTVRQGRHRQVLEVGHVTLNAHGKTCVCGNTGCVELYASVPSLCRDALGLAEDFQATDWLVYLKKVLRMADEGDAACLAAIEREVAYVGQAIITLINLFDIDTIVICSLFACARDRFEAPLNAYVRQRVTARMLFQPRIRFSSLSDGRLLGGGIYMLHRFNAGELGVYEDVIERHTALLADM